MKIDEIDKNFAIPTDIMREGAIFHDVRKAPFALYGLERAEDASLPFHRLDPTVAEATSAGVAELNYHTAGGRVRFATDSPYILLYCETAKPMTCMPHMPFSGSQGFDLYVKRGDAEVFRKTFFPPMDALGKTEFSGVLDTHVQGMTSYTLDFPLYGTCKRLLLGLAPVA